MLPIYYESGGSGHLIDTAGVYELVGEEADGIAIMKEGDSFSVPVFGIRFQDYLKAYSEAVRGNQGFVDLTVLQKPSVRSGRSAAFTAALHETTLPIQ